MTYSIITPADNADFFAQFKTFVVSAGWTIDAQSDTELYIHSGTKYLGFRLGTITYNTSSSAIFFTCAINSAYDSTKDWFNQPDSSISNLNPSYLPMYSTTAYTRYLPCIYCPNGITTAVFVGDADNIIVKIKRGTYVHDAIVVTWLNKKHTFDGGAIVASSSFMLGITNTSTGWRLEVTSREIRSGYLFSCAMERGRYGLPGVLFLFNTSFVTVISATDFILTNIYSNDSTSVASTALPFSPKPILDSLAPSSYTGLYPLVTPDFFYLNVDKYCYAGNVEKIKIINKSGLVDQQLLSYGNKDYLILAVIAGNVFATTTPPTATSNFIAVELT